LLGIFRPLFIFQRHSRGLRRFTDLGVITPIVQSIVENYSIKQGLQIKSVQSRDRVLPVKSFSAVVGLVTNNTMMFVINTKHAACRKM